MSALDFLLGPSFEVVLAGSDIRPLQRAVFASFVPRFAKEEIPISKCSSESGII
jgi:hypothetical protein